MLILEEGAWGLHFINRAYRKYSLKNYFIFRIDSLIRNFLTVLFNYVKLIIPREDSDFFINLNVNI